MDQLAELRKSTGAALCVACGKCSTMCPLARTGGFSARLIAGQDLQAEIEGRGVGVGRCLTCASCEERCPQGVRFTEFVRGLRELTPPEAKPPVPHGGIFRTTALSMTGPEAPKRGREWLGEGLETAEEGEVALFVGCLPLFDAYFGEDLDVRPLDIARSAVRLLNHQGIRPVIVDEERCCGHDLLWSGEREPFEALARENTRAFEARGVKRIITTCAECASTWRTDYAAAVPSYQPRVEHIAEFLSGCVEKGTLVFGRAGDTEAPERLLRGAADDGDGAILTYQDPCRLGRHLGVYDAPRRVLESLPGTKLVEMPRTGRDAVCCGTSGFIHCDAVSRGLQTERLAEAAGTGAGTLVTACPKCLIHFTCAQTEDRRRERREPEVGVVDFTVLAASRLAGNGTDGEKIPAPEGRAAGETR